MDTDLDIHCGHCYVENQCLISSLNYSSPCGISNKKYKLICRLQNIEMVCFSAVFWFIFFQNKIVYNVREVNNFYSKHFHFHILNLFWKLFNTIYDPIRRVPNSDNIYQNVFSTFCFILFHFVSFYTLCLTSSDKYNKYSENQKI